MPLATPGLIQSALRPTSVELAAAAAFLALIEDFALTRRWPMAHIQNSMLIIVARLMRGAGFEPFEDDPPIARLWRRVRSIVLTFTLDEVLTDHFMVTLRDAPLPAICRVFRRAIN